MCPFIQAACNGVQCSKVECCCKLMKESEYKSSILLKTSTLMIKNSCTAYAQSSLLIIPLYMMNSTTNKQLFNLLELAQVLNLKYIAQPRYAHH